MQTVAHSFTDRDLVGGDLAVDLVNTVTAWNARPLDWLDSYARLLEWASVARAVDARTLVALRRASRSHPAKAARALGRTRTLREHLYRLLTAMIRAKPAKPEHLRELENLWKDAAARARAQISDGQLRLIPTLDRSGLDYITDLLALRSFTLLESLPLERTRICDGDRCGWMFIDRSRGGQRRWCDMATCGNAAKARRFLERRKA